MIDIQIFDENGKALHIADVISRFIELKAVENNARYDNVAICRKGEKTISVDKISSVTGECVGTFEICTSNGL